MSIKNLRNILIFVLLITPFTFVIGQDSSCIVNLKWTPPDFTAEDMDCNLAGQPIPAGTPIEYTINWSYAGTNAWKLVSVPVGQTTLTMTNMLCGATINYEIGSKWPEDEAARCFSDMQSKKTVSIGGGGCSTLPDHLSP